MSKQKSPEEIKREQEEAQKKINGIIDQSAPKGLGQGLSSGVGNIVAGAVGGVGVAVMAPTAGLGMGLANGGVVGGIFGLAGGAVVGVVGGAALAVTGVVSGVTQVVRGVLAAPQAAIAPSQGKWWNECERKWVKTNMEDEAKALKGVPEDDKDILGGIEKELDESARGDGGNVEVKDMLYYDALQVPADAEEGTIRRNYYKLARKYHPDRNKGDEEAADKFKDVAEAYQVLSDPKLREKYNKLGKDGLSADRTASVAKLDPSVLFAFLFGSDKFNDYVGRLATATAASIGDSPKVSMLDARKLQKRRVARLSLKMISKITPWINAKDASAGTDVIEEEWKKEVAELSNASYGYELVSVVGKLYNLMGIMYQGSINSGQGLPSIADWAQRQRARMDKKSATSENQMKALKAAVEMLKIQNELGKKMEEAKTDEEKAEIAKQMEDSAASIMLRVLWTTTVVDITSTIYEVTHMVFFDQSVDKKTRMSRSEAMKVLGKIWMDCPEPESAANEEEQDAKKLYEEAAFAAMLETVQRKDASQA